MLKRWVSPTIPKLLSPAMPSSRVPSMAAVRTAMCEKAQSLTSPADRLAGAKEPLDAILMNGTPAILRLMIKNWSATAGLTHHPTLHTTRMPMFRVTTPRVVPSWLPTATPTMATCSAAVRVRTRTRSASGTARLAPWVATPW